MKAYDLHTALSEPLRVNALFLSNYHFEKLPESIRQCANLKQLILSDNKISTLPEWLSELSNLEALDLSNNAFKVFPEVLSQCYNLKSLILDYNQIEELPSFSKWQRLNHLSVKGNKIAKLQKDFYDPCFKSLDLSENQLKRLPSSIGMCIGLEKLIIANNKIRMLPVALSKCTALRILDGANNRINILPEELGKCNKLEKVNFFKNKLIALTDAIRNWTWLRQLDIARNKIIVLPNGLCELKWLIEFDCSFNQISFLPKNIGAIDRLETFKADYNNFSQLPQSFFHLKKLRHLHLRKLNLKITPIDLLHFERLKSLNGLHHVLDAKNKKAFLGFLQTCHDLSYDYSMRKSIYQLWKNGEGQDVEFIIKAMSFPIKQVRQKANQLFWKSKKSIQRFEEGTNLAVTGKFKYSKQHIIEMLEAEGINYQKKADESTTHFLVGDQPNIVTLLGAYKKCILLNAADLQALIKRHSLSKKQLEADQVSRIRKLLWSHQPSNQNIALGILQNTQVPQDMITDLFLIWKRTSVAAIKRKTRYLLEEYASTALQQKLAWRLPLHRNLDTSILQKNLQNYAAGTELETGRALKILIGN